MTRDAREASNSDARSRPPCTRPPSTHASGSRPRCPSPCTPLHHNYGGTGTALGTDGARRRVDSDVLYPRQPPASSGSSSSPTPTATNTPSSRRAALAQEPARQRQRWPDHRSATASTRTATSRATATTTTRARPDAASETYRGAAAASEPETQAHARAAASRRFRVPWSTTTRTPAAALQLSACRFRPNATDDHDLSVALSGTDLEPGHPWVAEPRPSTPSLLDLYTTNGETTELCALCARHARLDARARRSRSRRGNGLASSFQDDPSSACRRRSSINLPFALDVAKSAADPAHPGLSPRRDAPNRSTSTRSSSHTVIHRPSQVNAARSSVLSR